MVTKPAMTTTKIARRMSFGMTLRIAEMTMLQQVRMTRTERPMPMPLNSEVVMAKRGHMPISCTRAGFWVTRPSFNCFLTIHSLAPSLTQGFYHRTGQR